MKNTPVCELVQLNEGVKGAAATHAGGDGGSAAAERLSEIPSTGRGVFILSQREAAQVSCHFSLHSPLCKPAPSKDFSHLTVSKHRATAWQSSAATTFLASHLFLGAFLFYSFQNVLHGNAIVLLNCTTTRFFFRTIEPARLSARLTDRNLHSAEADRLGGLFSLDGRVLYYLFQSTSARVTCPNTAIDRRENEKRSRSAGVAAVALATLKRTMSKWGGRRVMSRSRSGETLSPTRLRAADVSVFVLHELKTAAGSSALSDPLSTWGVFREKNKTMQKKKKAQHSNCEVFCSRLGTAVVHREG